METLVNYNTGQTSAFAFAGVQGGWAGGMSGSIYSGLVYGLNGSNTNYSGGFTTGSFGANIFGFASAGSGGLTNGFGGPFQLSRPVVFGGGISAGLLGKFSGGVTATNYTSPLQLGTAGLVRNPLDMILYLAKQVACK